jgi:hypothetical protein
MHRIRCLHDALSYIAGHEGSWPSTSLDREIACHYQSALVSSGGVSARRRLPGRSVR